MEERAADFLSRVASLQECGQDSQQFIEENVFSDAHFLLFMQRTEPHHETITGPQVEFPVATLPAILCENFSLSPKQAMIRLSLYTIVKQNRNHPEIKLHYYTKTLIDILQHGEAIREKRAHYKHHMLIFLEITEDNELKIIKATIKVTQQESDKRLYLQSLHYVDEHRFQSERKRGLVIRHTLTHTREQPKPFLDFIDV
jgi:hypothetical protein